MKSCCYCSILFKIGIIICSMSIKIVMGPGISSILVERLIEFDLLENIYIVCRSVLIFESFQN